MKKILFITVRDPFSGRFSGDVIRANKYINFLSKRNKICVVSLGKNNKTKSKGKLFHKNFEKQNFFLNLIYLIKFFLQLKPLHFSFFYSREMEKYIHKNFDKFDIIFFQSIRSFQYFSDKINRKIILDMGDLYSKNYYQTYQELFFFHPLKIVYFFESFLIKKYERFCLLKANKTLLFSKKEIAYLKKISPNKLFQINFGIDSIRKKYKFDIKNYKIIFVGNIKYAPNRKACIDFIKKIFPKIREQYPEIEFHIFGEIYLLDKVFFMNKRNVKIFGKVKKLEPYLSNVICGLANLDISTGVQTKLLTYMSYGIPSICSKKVFLNFDKIKSIKLDYYNNKDEFIDLILKLKNNKNYSNNISSKSLKIVELFKWTNVLKTFNKVFK